MPAGRGFRAASRRRSTGGGTAPTAVHLTTNGSTTDGTVYTTASITPTGNRLVLAAVLASVASGSTSTVALTGNGLTWVQVAQTSATSTNRSLHLFRALAAAPTAGAVTITSGVTLNGCAWTITQFAGVDTTGTSGSGAVVQFIAQRALGGTNTSAGFAFDNAVTSGNATFGAVGINASEALTAGSGWTALGQQALTSPVQALMGQASSPGQQNVDASWTTAGNVWAVGAEVKAP